MQPSWREHLVDEGDGTMRIKAHGMMKADARLVTDAAHMQRHADDRGPEQLVNTAALPGIVGEAWAMADWHYGYGFPIGGVVATDTEAGELGGAISPGGVGFDINCGVRFMALDATVNDIPNLKKLAGRLAGRIPAGGSGKGGVDINQQDLGELLQRGAHAAVDLGYGLHEDLNQLESQGLLSTEEANVSQRARERGLRSLGTLGSGNHFLELQTVGQVVDEATAKAWGLYEDQVVAMIHSGSRGLGHQVCTDHVRQLEASYKLQQGVWHNEAWGYALPDRQLAAAPVHSNEGQAYLDAMNAAANFAFANRAVLADRLRTVLKLEMGVDGEARTLYDVAHNIAKMETHVVHGRSCSCCVHRKGATLPSEAITLILGRNSPTRVNRLSYPVTWVTVRGSWRGHLKGATWRSVHRPTERVGPSHAPKPRRRRMQRPSSDGWKNRAYAFTPQHPTCFRKRHQTPTKTWTKSFD